MLQWNLRIKDTLGQGVLSFIERFPLFQHLKCTGIIGIGTSRFFLYREVFFIRSVLHWRFHCTSLQKLVHIREDMKVWEQDNTCLFEMDVLQIDLLNYSGTPKEFS